MHLFHFSDDPDIRIFHPRPVRVPLTRAPGMDWLNGALVWAIDEAHEPLYLFPRECPRILIWPVDETSDEDRNAWFPSGGRMIAYFEHSWLDRIKTATIVRYELPSETFEDLNDAGMWVSREAVSPLGRTQFANLPEELANREVKLRVLETLSPLRGVWQTTLHVSGIRLRNAQGWA